MKKIAYIRIRNYRCFGDHTIEMRSRAVILGRNNAGKSTLIESLRLIAIALKKFRNPVTVAAPRWLTSFEPGPGIRLSLEVLGIQTETIYHRYGAPPAIISATFEDGATLDLFVGAEEAHAVFVAADGSIVRNRKDVAAVRMPTISILPQITPLERDEKVLLTPYIRQNMDSHLASRHFRNQLNLLWDEHFERFKALVEDTWHGVRIDGLEGKGGRQGDQLQLLVRDGDFVAEAGWMGHGLQMWLQTIWFVTRTAGGDTIVLDEPDVYMHPDLQRSLIRFLQKQDAQLIVATHSTEILAEVDFDAVLILDRTKDRSKFASSNPGVQKVIEQIGSAQNLQIARLWRSKSLVLVEGEDMKVLKRVFDVIHPGEGASFDTIPNLSVGGWSGWANARGSAIALRNSVHEDIKCYCLFDSDYHTPEEKEERYKQAAASEIQLHILEKKELENYFLLPALIRRVLVRGVIGEASPPSEEEIAAALVDFAERRKEETVDAFAQQFSARNKGESIGRINGRARQHVAGYWSTSEGKLSVVSGKALLSDMSTWAAQKCGVSFGIGSIVRELRQPEVHSEIANFVDAVARSKKLSSR